MVKRLSSNTLGRSERLKSRKLIGGLFSKGKAVTVFPLRVLYQPQAAASERPMLQAGFSVSSRNFKRAVDRNRIKRLLRECYRTQKHPLADAIEKQDAGLVIFFIYTGKEIPEYNLIKEKVAAAIRLLIKNISPMADKSSEATGK